MATLPSITIALRNGNDISPQQNSSNPILFKVDDFDTIMLIVIPNKAKSKNT
jgi:hypothetical protein